MQGLWVAAIASQARRAVELSSDGGSRNPEWHEYGGKGERRWVASSGKYQYRYPKSGGGKAQAARKQPVKPVSRQREGQKMVTSKLDGRSARAARDLKRLYDVVAESSVGVGAIEQVVEEIAKLPTADVVAIAGSVGVKVSPKTTRKAAVEAIKAALMEKKQPGSSQQKTKGESADSLASKAKGIMEAIMEDHEKVGFGQIEALHDQIAKLKPAEAKKVAAAFKLKVPLRASAPYVAREVRRKLTEQKGTAIQISAISRDGSRKK